MNKIIKINDETRFYIDKCGNYTLQYKKNSKDDRVEWRVEGYFSSLDQLLNFYISNAPARSHTAITTIREIIDIMKSAKEEVKKLVEVKL